MVKIENDCVGPCPQGCMGSRCPKRRTPHFYCDKCGEEFQPEELYDVDGEMLCDDCTLSLYKTLAQVGINEWEDSYD